MEGPVVKSEKKNQVQFNKERLDFFQNFKKSGLIKSHGPQVYLLKEIQEAEKCHNIFFFLFPYFFILASYSIIFPKRHHSTYTYYVCVFFSKIFINSYI